MSPKLYKADAAIYMQYDINIRARDIYLPRARGCLSTALLQPCILVCARHVGSFSRDSDAGSVCIIATHYKLRFSNTRSAISCWCTYACRFYGNKSRDKKAYLRLRTITLFGFKGCISQDPQTFLPCMFKPFPPCTFSLNSPVVLVSI